MRGKDRRLCWLVLDGVADRPAPALDGQTPLEAAATPNLDRLASAGINGTMDVSRPGTPPSSDRAHTLLFGYAHGEVPGRGVLEATGLDVSVPEDGVACSASFARAEAAEDGWTVTDRHLDTGAADCERASERVATFDAGDATVSFAYTWKNRGVVVLDPHDPDARPLGPAVTDADPFATPAPVLQPRALDDAPEPAAAARTADALAAFTRWSADRLADDSVDIVLAKWAGAPGRPESFAERHGLRACSLTPKPVLAGLAETLGMAVRDPPADYAARPDAILDAVDEFEFVHVHYPEPDEVSHAAGPAAKRDEIEAIDRSLEPVVDRALADDELVTVVTADHTTPSTEDVVHSGDPVPVTVVAEGVRTDDVSAVGERSAATGGLGRVRGRDLLRLSRAAADRVLLDGLRRTPQNRDYPNQPLEPLSRDP
jgi:2,3-bisphosphoglycerate-independent phosphoglycerate mutase